MDEVTMTVFSYDELTRLVGLIPKTDPTTSAYGTLLESIERYGAIAQHVDWILDLPDPRAQTPEIVQFNPPVAEDEKFDEPTPAPVEKTAEEPAKTSTYSFEEVKAALLKARMDGTIPSAKDWIRDNFKVDGLTAIPASMYDEVMTKLKEIGT